MLIIYNEFVSVCESWCIFYSHQGHLRWLWPRLRCFLRVHRFMEQSVPHPRRFIQCQPADETLQTVNTQHHSPTTFVSMTYHRQKPHTCNICNCVNMHWGEVTDKRRHICCDFLFSAIIINFVYCTLSLSGPSFYLE